MPRGSASGIDERLVFTFSYFRVTVPQEVAERFGRRFENGRIKNAHHQSRDVFSARLFARR